MHNNPQCIMLKLIILNNNEQHSDTDLFITTK